jgi:hypothetical protein
MTQSNSADAAEVVTDEKETTTYVTWGAQFPFQTREMRPQDWRDLGAKLTDDEVKEGKVTEWKAANGFRVPRDEIPLTDLQLGHFMGLNPGFAIIEG